MGASFELVAWVEVEVRVLFSVLFHDLRPYVLSCVSGCGVLAGFPLSALGASVEDICQQWEVWTEGAGLWRKVMRRNLR